MGKANGGGDVFRAVADPTRRTILISLRRGPKTVTQIARSFSVSRPAVSKHLKILRDSHLVTEQKRGRLHLYELNWKPLQRVDRWLRDLRQKRPSRIALFLLCIGLIGNSAFAVTVEDFAWVAGCWSNQEGESVTQENWMKPEGGSLLGVGRTVTKGKTVFHEFLQIRQEDDGQIYYIAQLPHAEPVKFKLKSLEGNLAIFENPDHDFPQRVQYRKEPDGSLHARIEGMDKGKSRASDFPMKAVPCE